MLISFIIRNFINRVDFSAEGLECEKILNYAVKNNIDIFFPKKSGFTLFGTVYSGNYKVLKKFALKNGIKLKIVNKKGPYFFFRKNKRKIPIVVGIISVMAVIALLNNFILEIDVKGNETVPYEEIIEIAQKNGLTTGTLKKSHDVRKIEWAILNDVKNLSWVSVNMQGCKANIVVNEARSLPEMKYDDDKPVNIIAARHGIIRKMDVFDGQDVAKVGDAVMKGELLVSAVYEDRYNKLTLKHSRANIIAETDYKIEVEFPFEQILEKTDHTKDIISEIDFLGFIFNFKNNDDDFQIIDEHEEYLYFLWIKLPIKVKKCRLKYVKQYSITYDIEQAKSGAYELLEQKEKEELKNTEILTKRIDEKIKNNKYIIVADYTCLMDIGEEQDILSNIPWENTDDIS